MALQHELIQADRLITMADIIREGNPTLRAHASDVTLPLSKEDLLLGEKMLEFLHNSQDEEIAEELELRGGVGLAAPQLDISKRIIALLVPNASKKDEEGNEIAPAEPYSLAQVMYNPKVLAESVQTAALSEGEGCLSVDRDVPGYVVRKARVTVDYIDKNGESQRVKLRGYNAIVVQHEIDHTNGIMFFDRIDPDDPWKMPEGMQLVK
jgi:peptide deformylase